MFNHKCLALVLYKMKMCSTPRVKTQPSGDYGKYQETEGIKEN